MHQIRDETTREAAKQRTRVERGESSRGLELLEETWFIVKRPKSRDYLAVGVRARILPAKRAPLQGVQNARGGRPRLGDLARRDVDPALDAGELLQQVLLDGIDRRGLRRR